MVDTGFWVEKEKVHRLSGNYMRHKSGKGLFNISKASAERYRKPYLADKKRYLSGGGGLLSTVSDYYRFCRMLLNHGQLEGVRILGAKTVAFMTKNHLPAGDDMRSFIWGTPNPLTADYFQPGVGFGLGFKVVLDPVASGELQSVGSFGWGGAASTRFWIDEEEQLIVIFMTQLMFNDHLLIRVDSWLHTAVYSALSHSYSERHGIKARL